MRTKWLSGLVGSVLCLLGGYALLCVFAGFSSIQAIPDYLQNPGAFLAQSFSWAAFYVPVYLFLCALLAFIPLFKRELIAVLNLTILPFLTVSLFLKLMFGDADEPVTGAIMSALGQKGAAFILLLLLVLELMLMFRVWSRMDSAADSSERGRSDGGRDAGTGDPDVRNSDPMLLEAPRVERAADLPVGEHAVPVDDAEDAPVDAGRGPDDPFVFNLPDFPPPEDLRSLRNAFARTETADDVAKDSSEAEWIGLDPDSGAAASSAPYAAGGQSTAAAEAGATAAVDAEPAETEANEEYVVFYRDGGFYEEVDEDPDTFDEDPDEIIDELDSSGASEATEPVPPLPAAHPAGAAAAAASSATVALSPAASGDANGSARSAAASAPRPTTTRTAPAPIRDYSVPLGELLDDYPDGEYWVIDEQTKRAADVLKHTLEEFNIQAEVTGIRKGPVITMYEILPAPGVKLSKIVNLADNIALRLAASRVRIVAPIPGKHAVGIEVPNRHRAIVSFKEMIVSDDFNKSNLEIPVILGKDITGNAQIVDLVETPHLLIAGATGSGKSVCVNSIICSVLSCRRPDEVRMILIDPKIVELKLYNDIPHLLTPVVTEPKKAYQALQYCIYEMERRYSLLDSMGVRDIRSYNKRVKERKLAQSPIPYILIIIDEFADLMATTGKELESTLARLAAMSRAVGIHLVLATQRPSIDVITGLIKANIPSRIAFMVASKFDSRIIIDAVGAEKLLGRGDMLFTSAQNPFPTRIQGAFLSEGEVERFAEHVKSLGEPEYIDDEIFIDDEQDEFSLMNDDGSDPIFDKALEIVVSAGKASASYLQRRLKIGYNRAARIVEDLEERGIVGPQQGSKPREVIHIPDRYRGE